MKPTLTPLEAAMTQPALYNAHTANALSAAILIPRHLLAAELQLSLVKWPAYRFLPPLEATRLFHREYVRHYKQHYAATIDRDTASRLRIGAQLDFSSPNRHLTQLWAARQHADARGAPYDAYLSFTFDFASRRCRRHPPQPNQLAPSQKAQQAWHAMFRDFWTPERARLHMAREAPVPQYHLAHDIGLAVQRLFREELLAIGAPPHCFDMDFLLHRAAVLDQIAPQDCLGHFPGDVFRQKLQKALKDRQEGRIVPHSYPRISALDLQPACFALPGIDAIAEENCQGCPMLQSCEAARVRLNDRVKALTGSDDPVAEKRRNKNRERVAACRARKKASLRRSQAAAATPSAV